MGRQYCCVPGCLHNTDDEHSSFFRVPKDTRSVIWLKNCRRTDLSHTSSEKLHLNYRVCNVHFEESMFANALKNRLTKNAIPTRFTFKGFQTCETREIVPEKSPRVAIQGPPGIKNLPWAEATSGRVFQINVKYNKTPAAACTSNLKQEHQTDEEISSASTSALQQPVGSKYLPWTKSPMTSGRIVQIDLKSAKTSVVALEPSTSSTSEFKQEYQTDEEITFSRTASTLQYNEHFKQDVNSPIDENEIKIEYCSEDEIGPPATEDEDLDQDTASNTKSSSNPNFILRREIFKQFVIKIIDEITNEKDLKALEDIFACAVPLPHQIQDDVKM